MRNWPCNRGGSERYSLIMRLSCGGSWGLSRCLPPALLLMVALKAASLGCTRECHFDTDCPGSLICEDGVCAALDLSTIEARECSQESDCSVREACIEGRCIVEHPTGGACESDAECSPPHTICGEDGTCEVGCSVTGCPEESHCGPDGRCVDGCLVDEHCSPPTTVCDVGLQECVSGCVEGDCADDHYCDPTTGRCKEGCAFDAACDPPHYICDDNECVEGCLETGCGTGQSCDEETGRCREGCDDHSDCDQPSLVCGDDGFCVDGCLVAGFCPEGLLCRPEDGLCEEPGSVALGLICDDGQNGIDHSLCETDFCLSVSTPFCSRLCTSTMSHCPEPGAFCRVFFSPRGIGACEVYGHEDVPPGSPCEHFTECKSWQCKDGECTDTCQHDRDCNLGGHVCRAATNDAEESFLLCAPPLAGAQGEVGDSCASHDDCVSNVCSNSRCVGPCHTSWDCPDGFICIPLLHRGEPEPIVMRGCVDAGRSTGAEPVGASCNPSTGQPCRSLVCATYNDGAHSCVDLCASNDDCPIGHRCNVGSIEFSGGTSGLYQVCIRR